MCAEAAKAQFQSADIVELHNPALYLNRELSHLEFQRRVLEEARDARSPLLERVKFLSILGSNMDEFFMVRVAGLLQQIENNIHEPGLDGRSPSDALETIRSEADRLMNAAHDFFRGELLPALAEQHIQFVEWRDLDAAAARPVRRPFCSEGLSGSYAAGYRSRAAISTYFESQPEHRRNHPGRGRQ